MPVKTKTETKPLVDPDLIGDPDDEINLKSAGAALLSPEQTVPGFALRPVTASIMALLQMHGNQLIYGDTSRMLLDAAMFCCLCAEDDDEFNEARKIAVRGDFAGYVLDWMDARPEAHTTLLQAAPSISQSLADYWNTLTKSAEHRPSAGNGGGRIG